MHIYSSYPVIYDWIGGNTGIYSWEIYRILLKPLNTLICTHINFSFHYVVFIVEIVETQSDHDIIIWNHLIIERRFGLWVESIERNERKKTQVRKSKDHFVTDDKWISFFNTCYAVAVRSSITGDLYSKFFFIFFRLFLCWFLYSVYYFWINFRWRREHIFNWKQTFFFSIFGAPQMKCE